ncbi:hypothetical protein FOF52_03900 [Thermobifida alba]|jgi:hypothetical protein|uniref:Uncharacterized protein n=2 Tax=Thermobifida TaxID=83677 RepID=A0A147KEC0_THECS|nr:MULTISPECIES: hypothetical protein [Thermobifida]KUP95589.1 hypothetical protein AC529_16760 [Thermobifida cellulosilytica TB100]UPT20214.1 hypothetical protein FOF52_03900 [Thermobifida alba]HLU97267.1 hypothetical protein [Thermobifida alba]
MAVIEQRCGVQEVSREAARTELARFFTVMETAEKAPEMFSAYIDAEWHRLLGSREYEALCLEAVGRLVGHRADAGQGTPSWLEVYHERYGNLPRVWFADAEGTVDEEMYKRYLATRVSGQRAEQRPLIVSWDCTPTTNDEDE